MKFLAGLLALPLFAATQLVFLGVGSPVPYGDRSGPAVAVVYNGKAYLFDAGTGIVRRARDASIRHDIPALDPVNLTRVFLTHLHSDHTIGLPDLMLTPWDVGRKAPLEIWGPAGTKAMVDHIRSAWDEDIHLRLQGLERGNATGHKSIVHEIANGFVYHDGDVEIRAIPVHHGSWKQAFGYRIQTPDRVIVLSGDCAPSPALIAACNGCDVLVHEVYEETGLKNDDWLKYMREFHTSSSELARIATKAKPRLLVLQHLLFVTRTIHADEIVAEVKRTYDGAVVAAKDLDVF
jgi:ribonuclease BN (tRNA processing enzyme)